MFYFNWVLNNELAISSYPKKESHINYLKKLRIYSVLNLCFDDEIENSYLLDKDFSIIRSSLPDHKKSYSPSEEDIKNALNNLNILYKRKPVLVHCFAGIERSPLICVAWLMFKYEYNLYQALDYIKQIHPPSCPLESHINVLKGIKNFKI